MQEHIRSQARVNRLPSLGRVFVVEEAVARLSNPDFQAYFLIKAGHTRLEDIISLAAQDEKGRIVKGNIPAVRATPRYYETVFHAEIYFALCCNAHDPRFLLDQLQDPAFKKVVDIALSRAEEDRRLGGMTDARLLRSIVANREKRKNAYDVQKTELFFKDTSHLCEEHFYRLAPLRSVILYDEEFTSLATDPTNWISRFDVVGQMGLNVWILDAFEDTQFSFASPRPPGETDAHEEILGVLSSDKELIFLYDMLRLKETPLGGISDAKKPSIFRSALGWYSIRFSAECDRMMRKVMAAFVWRLVDYDFK